MKPICALIYKLKNSLLSKLFAFTIFFGVIMVIASISITRDSVSELSATLLTADLTADFNYINDLIGPGDWRVEGTKLYKGDVYLGDGTEEEAFHDPFIECYEKTGTDFYVFVKVSDEGLVYYGDKKTGYMQGHFYRIAGSTKGPTGGSIVGTYMDKKVADVLDQSGSYSGPANVNGRQIYCQYFTMHDKDGEVIGAMVTGRSMEEVNYNIDNSVKRHVLFIVILVLIIQASMILLFIKWNKAIYTISDYLQTIAEGNFPMNELLIKTSDELEIVADGINNLTKSLKDGVLLDSFRKGIKSRSLFSVCFNATSGLVVEGKDVFAKYVDEHGNLYFHTMEQGFFATCIDSEYVDILQNSLKEDSLISQLDKDPEFEIVVRVSPKRFLENLNISDEVRETLEKYDEEYIWCSLRGVIVKDANKDIVVYIDVFDVHQKMIDAELIKTMALNDSLTGLLNRNAFTGAVREFMSENVEPEGCLFMFDLDHFKDVNDNLGHPQGDELLKKVADIIKSSFRENDVLCRLGGDEFCAFAKGLRDREMIEKKAAELNVKGRHDYHTETGKVIHVNFSVGVAQISDPEETFESLYKKADEALYAAKEAGRDCYSIG